ncbi:MAG: alpha/beta hydrolase [Beijerinckiaceae bacterium]|jgi:acetyl esterase|nr:alpha/beta hydrolase [Beijerinckiaceae bacterium]
MNKDGPVSPLAKIDLDRLLSPQAQRSAEMEATWQFIIEEDKKLPGQAGMSMAELRQAAARRNRRWNTGEPAVSSVERIRVPGLQDAPEIECDLYTPENAKPGCIVYIHGGGWANGSIESHTRVPRTLANAVGLRVLNVEYRLAPEHPHPAGLEDCVAAWRWLVEQAEKPGEFRGPLGISGDSAGANLAVTATMHEIRARRRFADCGLLFYGVYGCDFDTPSYQRFGSGFGLMRAGMENFLDMYAPGGAGPDALRYEPLVSPVLASEALLARLPPLYLNAAGLDPLLCDSYGFAQRLEEAGVKFDINVHDGVHHGFMQITERLSEARRAYDLAAAFFATATSATA